MKRLTRKSKGSVIVLPLCILFAGLIILPAEGGQNLYNRSGTVQMIAGETGYSGITSPPGPFGDYRVELRQNAYVDSYDSRIGPYIDTEGCEARVGSNVNPNDSEAGIHLNQNSTVCGDVAVTTPEEDEGKVTTRNHSEISGSTLYDQPQWELKPLNMPNWYTEEGGGPYGEILGEFGKNKDYDIYETAGYQKFEANVNADVMFSAGTYHFDIFELRNNVNFVIDPEIGPGETVDIYVSKSIIFENNSELLPAIAITGDTTKLRFYFDGTSKVDLSNNVKFFGFIYAPNALIEVRNNDEIYGNLVGKELYIWNNAAVHFDKALMDEDFSHIFTGGIPARPHRRVEWRELVF